MLKLRVIEKSLGAGNGEEPDILEPDCCYILDGIEAISVGLKVLSSPWNTEKTAFK